LTFIKRVAGYQYEGAHTLYWLVHPFRPVLAGGAARGDSSPNRVAHISAATPHRHCCARCVCVDSGGVVFAGSGVGRKEDLNPRNMRYFCAILLFAVVGCKAGLPKVGNVSKPLMDEIKVTIIAQNTVAAHETWLDRAEFETPIRRADGSWSVHVWRLPKTFGGDRIILVNEKGEVTGYIRGL
jgi:hypothetical protein